LAEIKLTTEVAGRVCAVPVNAGARVRQGDDVVMVEAMKMEIPVSSPSKGKIKSILVGVDDAVTEGQAVAILET
jgi:biotin carboxyl carrier protein